MSQQQISANGADAAGAATAPGGSSLAANYPAARKAAGASWTPEEEAILSPWIRAAELRRADAEALAAQLGRGIEAIKTRLRYLRKIDRGERQAYARGKAAPRISPDDYALIRDLRAAGTLHVTIAKRLGLALNTVIQAAVKVEEDPSLATMPRMITRKCIANRQTPLGERVCRAEFVQDRNTSNDYLCPDCRSNVGLNYGFAGGGSSGRMAPRLRA